MIERYNRKIVILHWIVAVFLVLSFALGLQAGTLDESPTKDALLTSHKSIGLTILMVLVVRLYWRFRIPGPVPARINKMYRFAAYVVHGLLYAMLIAMAVSGYVAVAARGGEITLFFLVDLPAAIPLSRRWSRLATQWHDWGQYVVYALLVAHIGAVFYHQFVLRDRILMRMWFKSTPDHVPPHH